MCEDKMQVQYERIVCRVLFQGFCVDMKIAYTQTLGAAPAASR